MDKLILTIISLLVCLLAKAQTTPIKWSYPLRDMSFGQTSAMDVDGDGKLELFFSTYWNDSFLYCLNAEDGSLKWKQPVKGSIGGCNDAAPLIFDPYSNGNYKVVLPGSCSDTAFCFDADSSYSQWKTVMGGSDSPPSVADIDNDGIPELLFGNFYAKVMCLNSRTGAVKWTTPQASTVPYVAIQTEPAIIKNPTGLDFVIGTWDRNNADSNKLICYNGYNHTVKWKHAIHNMVYEGAAIGDLYKNGRKEVVIGDYSDTIYNIDAETGTINWKVCYSTYTGFVSAVTLADIDNDGYLNIIYNDITHLYVLKPDGSLLWKYNCSYNGSLRGSAVADVNNDQYYDITFATGDGRVISLSGNDGALIKDVDLGPIYGDTFRIDHAPIIADFDHDGTLDLFVIGGQAHNNFPWLNYGKAYCLSWGVGHGPEWTIFRRDERRNACLCNADGLPLSIFAPDLITTQPITAFPNPATGIVSVNLGNLPSAGPTISVLDISGKVQIEQLADHKTLTQKIDIRSLPAGLYLVQIKTPDQNFIAKFIKQ